MNRIVVAAAIIEHEGRYLLARRRDGGSRDGMWEFPGGKVEPGESPEEALVREIREELRVSIAVGRRMAEVEWDYPDISIRLVGISARIDRDDGADTAAGAPFTTVDHDEVAWFGADQLRSLPLLPADVAMLSRLEGERSGC